MRLFLSQDLCKSESPSPKQGTYVGRVQTSVGADGSPVYKYFYDAKEYEQYMANKRSGGAEQETDKEDPAELLKEEVAKEGEESKKKANTPPGAADKKSTVEKSLRLYVVADPVLYVRMDK